MQSVSKSPLTRDLKIFSFLGWIFQLQPFLCFQPLPSVVGISQDAKPAQGLNLDKFSELVSFKSRLEFGKRTRSEISLSE